MTIIIAKNIHRRIHTAQKYRQ